MAILTPQVKQHITHEVNVESQRQLTINGLKCLLEQRRDGSTFQPCDFRDSMAWKRQPTESTFYELPEMKLVEELFSQFCEKIEVDPGIDTSTIPENCSIPPKIHAIWLGSPIGESEKLCVDSWKKYHPGWEIKIWTDKDVKNFPWSCKRSKQIFENAETLAEKADILRYEILLEGGIYTDTDVVCTGAFHQLVSNGLSFFGGFEMNYTTDNHPSPVYIGSAIMGAEKNSSVMKYAIKNFQTSSESSVSLPMRGGPGLIGQACQDELQSKDDPAILLLPCTYFYAYAYHRSKETKEVKVIQEHQSPESLAIHLWKASWMK